MKLGSDTALFFALLIVSTSGSWSGAARAATFEVTTIDDSGAGSLRQAILDANAAQDGANTITFDLDPGSVILLSSPLPDVSQSLTIDGGMTDNLSVRGDGVDRILRVATGTTALRDLGLNDGILQIARDARLTFDLETAQTIQDVITEERSLEKQGSSTLTFLGANDDSGGTLVSEGTLRENTESLQGTIDVGEAANLVFEQGVGGDVTVEGAIAPGDGLAELAYRSGALTVQPLAALDYARVQQDGFSESGAASLNLVVDEETLSSVGSGLGVRILGTSRMDERSSLTGELRGRWNHEFGDGEREILGRITGASGRALTVRGAEPPRDSATLGASWGVISAERPDYDAIFGEDLIDHSGGVGVRFFW